MMAWTIFTHPMFIGFHQQIWLLLPICVSVAIVYKTIRTEDLRRLPRQIGVAFAQMVGGLIALSVVLWALQEFWP